ncbi:MAG TPA: hypothetical protein PKG67_05380 [Turneriella sp.]|nr:hypothetical protein [Turneriella sp.]
MKKVVITICFLCLGFIPVEACPITKAKNLKEIKLRDGTVKLGTLQVSAKNQDPIVAFYREGKPVFCSADYDTSPVDARAVTATADKEHLYVVFSTDGGAKHPKTFTRFTASGWQESYGAGGGAKVLVILKIRKADGVAVAGTYITAKKQDGKTNSVALKKLEFNNNSVRLVADAWYSPLKTDKTPYECSGSSPFAYILQLSADLTTAMSTAVPQCK